MKPPRRVRDETAGTQDPLASLISAFQAGRLVALLRGEGLTKSTVHELLRPESAVKLQEILTESVFSGREERAYRYHPRHEKGLVIDAKETFKR